MSLKKRAADFLFSTAVATLYCYALTLHIFASTVLELPESKMLLYSAASAVFFYFAFWNRRVSIIFGGLLAAGGAYAFFAYKNAWFGVEIITDAKKIIENLTRFFLGFGAEKPEYAMFFGVVLTAGLGLFVMLNLRVGFGFYLLALFAAEIIAVPVHMGWGGSEKGVMIMAFCLFILLVKKLNLLSLTKKGESGINPVFALAAVPVCALVFTGAYFLPKPDITVSPLPTREEISRYAKDIGNVITSFTPPEAAVFSDRLGGPITQGNRLVMEVEAPEPLYLAGSIRDIYTGHSWETSAEGRQGSGLEPYSGPYSAELAKSQGYFMRYYGRLRETATVTIRNSRTRTIFTPPFYNGLAVDSDMLLRMDSFGMITSSGTLTNGDSYSQEYISWDYSNTYFVNILRELAAQNAGGRLDTAEKERFLALPDSLPERVRELALSLTSGLNNNYDKLKALEAYLASYPYTLSPGNVPNGHDFVDYFLFEEKQGYCVYYATAFAVMARCAGIPARYVEGYITPQENENGVYKVTEKQAHAWVEAYFDGFGWVRFEPTSPFFADLYGDTAPEPQEEEITPPVANDTEPESPAEPLPERDTPARPETESDNKSPTRSRTAFPLIFAAILLIPAAVMLLNILRGKKMLALKNNEAAVTYFKLAVNAAGACGCSTMRSETALAFAKRTAGDLGEGMEKAARVFSKAAYSPGEITDSEKNIVIECYKALIEKLKKTMFGKARYFTLKYVLMRI